MQVVSAWTGVPVERMSEDDRDRLLTLADALKVGARVALDGGGAYLTSRRSWAWFGIIGASV